MPSKHKPAQRHPSNLRGAAPAMDGAFELETIALDKKARTPQYQQLETQIRQAIGQGLLRPGASMPASRVLAKRLGVSRNTVLAAYEQLQSEGFLVSKRGSGTVVTDLDMSPWSPSKNKRGEKRTVGQTAASKSTEATNPQTLATTPKPSKHFSNVCDGFESWHNFPGGTPRAFRPHIPDLKTFPTAVWQKLLHEQARWSQAALQGCDPLGYAPLREAMAQYMAISRGVPCCPEQILITAGTQHGLGLLADVLLEPGATVWVEEPGNLPAAQALALRGHQVVPVGLDASGMDPGQVMLDQVGKNKASKASTSKPDLICMTPSCQWPMAMTMPLARRLAWLQVAQENNAWILEDDYNGEYRYTGRPQPPLCGLDTSGRTIHMGSFSKLLFPGIRLGFLMVPESLAPALAHARWLGDRFSSPLQQMALHRFMAGGHFLKHIRKMRVLLAQRQTCLVQALRSTFGDVATVEQPEAGMHVVLFGKSKAIEKQLEAAAQLANIEFHPVRMYAQQGKESDGLILGFAAIDCQRIQQGVLAWRDAYENLKP